MKNLLLILLIIIPAISFCQNEYKITTESAIRQEYSGSEAVVTAFVTITNIGNPDNWYENFSGFVLQSKNTREVYKLVDARSILKDEIMPGGVISASLSFLVPKSADSIYLRYPLRYGGKETFLFRSYYLSKNDNGSETYVGESGIVLTTGQKPDNKEGDKNSSNPDNKEGNNNSSNPDSKEGSNNPSNPDNNSGNTRSTPKNEPSYFYSHFTGGMGLMKTNSGNKNHLFWQVRYTMKPVLHSFKKKKLRLVLDFDIGITSIHYSVSDKSDRYLDFYGIDKNKWEATNDSGNVNPINNWNIYGGVGVVYDKNPKVAPYISLKFGWNWVNNSYVRIYPKLYGPNNYISRGQDLDGPGIKIDAGIYLFDIICFSYNFYSFKATSGNSILNAAYTGHFINFSFAGASF